MNRFPHLIALVLVCVPPAANAQVSALQQGKIHRNLEELRAKIAFLEGKIRVRERQFDQDHAVMQDRLKQSQAQIVSMQKHYSDRIDAMELNLHDAVSERKRLEAINRHLRLRLQDAEKVEVDQDLDGRIVSVNDNGKTVEIDLGHADAAFVGLQLDVLFPHSLTGQNPSDAEVALSLLLQSRCRIEVISVDTENRSKAKVLPGADNQSLQVGAALVSPLWHRQQRHTVVILEDIENEDLITQALWEAGLEARKLTGDSDISEWFDGQTRYVVVADFDQLSERDDTKLSENYWRATTVALEYAIPVLDVKRLLIRHPIPRPGSEAASQMLERFQERRIATFRKREQEAVSADQEKSTEVKSANEKSQPRAETPGDPFANE